MPPTLIAAAWLGAAMGVRAGARQVNDEGQQRCAPKLN
jgi:hypothetical protein